MISKTGERKYEEGGKMGCESMNRDVIIFMDEKGIKERNYIKNEI